MMMKRFFVLTAATAFSVQMAIAANEPATTAAPPKGCAAKVTSIQKELSVAKSKGQTRRAKGLEDALRAAEKCDDQALLAEREKKVRNATDKVGEREAELQKEVSDGKPKDIAKARKKLAEAQKELTDAKAELQR